MREPPRYSIRSRLIWGILLVVGGTLMASAMIGYQDARHETEELFDARLAQSSRTLNPLLVSYRHLTPQPPTLIYDPWDKDLPAQEAESDTDEDEARPLGHTYESKLYFLLLDAHGTLLLRSPAAPVQAKPVTGFGQARHDGHNWRTFTLYDATHHTWLIVADREDARSEMAEKIAIQIIRPLLISLPLLLILLWWLVNIGTRPLTELIQAISERHPANLSPLVIRQPVEELLPLTGEINRLMRALADTLEHEKQFTNEAAHELRTPLAVLRIHGENALLSQDPEGREQSLRKMLAAIDRGDRLLRQLLTQARIDHQQSIELEPIDLSLLLRETIAGLVPLALKKNQDLALDAPEQIWVQGQPILLDLLFNNLIDNAIRYTPENGSVLIKLNREHHHAYIHIIDTGPGVDPAQLPRLQERFFRINPQQGDGAGLGLSIVKKIALLHAATLQIRNREIGGLDIELTLPIIAAVESKNDS